MDLSDEDRDDMLFNRAFAGSAKQGPTAQQFARWQDHFVSEIRAVRRRRTLRRWVVATTGIAALLAFGVWLTWSRPAAPLAPVVAEVATAFGGNVVRGDGGIERTLGAGAVIRDGERVESGQRSGLGTRYRNADVRLRADSVVIFHADRLELRHGAVYLDVPEHERSTQPLRVDTPLGSFIHAGTQFQIAVSDGAVSGAVREGAIVLHGPDGDVRLAAGNRRGRMVVIRSSGGMRETPVPTSGPLWAWTLASAPGIVVAGRSPADVLHGLAHQRGERVVYSGRAAEQLARDDSLSGSATAVDPADVIRTVDRATRLRVVESGSGEILVSLDSEGDQNAH